MNETISQLIDRELDVDQQSSAIEKILGNDSAGRTWQSYQLIGDIMRGDVDRVGPDLADRISECIKAEPTVLIPRRPAPRNHGADTAIRKPAGLFALAASVVVAVVIALGPVDDSAQRGRATTVEQPGPESSGMEFNEMLSGHGEFTSSPAFNGLLSYMVLASSQTPVRPVSNP